MTLSVVCHGDVGNPQYTICFVSLSCVAISH